MRVQRQQLLLQFFLLSAEHGDLSVRAVLVGAAVLALVLQGLDRAVGDREQPPGVLERAGEAGRGAVSRADAGEEPLHGVGGGGVDHALHGLEIEPLIGRRVRRIGFRLLDQEVEIDLRRIGRRAERAPRVTEQLEAFAIVPHGRVGLLGCRFGLGEGQDEGRLRGRAAQFRLPAQGLERRIGRRHRFGPATGREVHLGALGQDLRPQPAGGGEQHVGARRAGLVVEDAFGPGQGGERLVPLAQALLGAGDDVPGLGVADGGLLGVGQGLQGLAPGGAVVEGGGERLVDHDFAGLDRRADRALANGCPEVDGLLREGDRFLEVQLIALVHGLVVQRQGVQRLVVDGRLQIGRILEPVVGLLEAAGVGGVQRPVQIGLGPRAPRGALVQRAGAETPFGVSELPALVVDIGHAQDRGGQAGGVDLLGLVARRFRRRHGLGAPAGDDLEAGLQKVGNLFQAFGCDDGAGLQGIEGARLVDHVIAAAAGGLALTLGDVPQPGDLDRLGRCAGRPLGKGRRPCATFAEEVAAAVGVGVEPSEIIVPAPASHRPGVRALAHDRHVVVVGQGLADVAGPGAGPQQERVRRGGAGDRPGAEAGRHRQDSDPEPKRLGAKHDHRDLLRQISSLPAPVIVGSVSLDSGLAFKRRSSVRLSTGMLTIASLRTVQTPVWPMTQEFTR